MPPRRFLLILIPLALLLLTCGAVTGAYTAYLQCCTYRIRYTLNGTGTADVRYTPGESLLGRADLRNEQVTLPWSAEFVSDNFLHREHALLYADSTATTSLTCEVWIRGHLAERNSAAGTVACGYDPERNPVP
jgi:hypothetical protein